MPSTIHAAMKCFKHQRSRLFACLVAIQIAGVWPVFGDATNSVVWDREKEQMTADIRGWGLIKLLETIAAQTGWMVWVEPDAQFRASAKFKELSATQALRRLLGDLNYALLPQTNGPQRLYVFRTSMSQATQQVRTALNRPALQGKPIPNELIVRVKPGTDIEALAKALGAKVVGRIPELNAYRLQFEDEAAAAAARKKLAAEPEVLGVESNFYLEKPFVPQSVGGTAPPPNTLSFDPVKRDTSKVTIGLVDTGLQKLDPALEQFVQDRVSLAGAADLSAVAPTHATSMLNAMVQAMQRVDGGGSTGVQIISFDIFGPNPQADSFTGALGMYEAYKQGATVINNSWGDYGQSPVVTEVVQFLTKEGVTVVAAMGNDGSTSPFYPAAIPEVLSVTALERGEIAYYSNVGTTPDVAAPGQVIFGHNGLAYGSRGTSVASAVAAGVAARVAETTGATGPALNTSVQKILAVPTTK
jgi:hypothetical protein